MLSETNETLAMIAALDAYWQAIHELQVADQVMLASLDVFGRDPRSDGNGRSHYGEMVSGLMVGTHLRGGLVGGLEVTDKARASGINSATGTAVDPDIDASDTLTAYYRTIMHAAGIPADRQATRLPTGALVTSITG